MSLAEKLLATKRTPNWNSLPVNSHNVLYTVAKMRMKGREMPFRIPSTSNDTIEFLAILVFFLFNAPPPSCDRRNTIPATLLLFIYSFRMIAFRMDDAEMMKTEIRTSVPHFSRCVLPQLVDALSSPAPSLPSPRRKATGAFNKINRRRTLANNRSTWNLFLRKTAAW